MLNKERKCSIDPNKQRYGLSAPGPPDVVLRWVWEENNETLKEKHVKTRSLRRQNRVHPSLGRSPGQTLGPRGKPPGKRDLASRAGLSRGSGPGPGGLSVCSVDSTGVRV